MTRIPRSTRCFACASPMKFDDFVGCDPCFDSKRTAVDGAKDNKVTEEIVPSYLDACGRLILRRLYFRNESF